VRRKQGSWIGCTDYWSFGKRASWWCGRSLQDKGSSKENPLKKRQAVDDENKNGKMKTNKRRVGGVHSIQNDGLPEIRPETGGGGEINSS